MILLLLSILILFIAIVLFTKAIIKNRSNKALELAIEFLEDPNLRLLYKDLPSNETLVKSMKPITREYWEKRIKKIQSKRLKNKKP